MTQQLALVLDSAPPKVKRASALRSFHVRSHVTASEALAGEKKAQRQEDQILAWFRSRGGRWTPWDVAESLGLCINSARRSCTNLTRRGLLVHWRGDRRPAGPWGQRSGTWEAA